MVMCSVATQGLAQGVTLPNGTGQIVPPAGWTVLQQAELEMQERATDPTAPNSRAVVLTAVEELRKNQRTARNVLLHRQGPGDDALQLINCYSADVSASSEELLGKEAVEQIRDAIIEQMSTDQLKVQCTGYETSQLWAVPSLVMHFKHDDASSPWQMDMQIVPAGDHLQYFECQFTVTDTTARQNIQDVLATFDGAKEPDSRVSNLLIGGLAGAAAGIITALFRRKRQQQRMTAAGV
tara:strand:- start:32680 stop:33393 length:714 start_codon:yes stop_codon:yes gene_type:complete